MERKNTLNSQATKSSAVLVMCLAKLSTKLRNIHVKCAVFYLRRGTLGRRSWTAQILYSIISMGYKCAVRQVRRGNSAHLIPNDFSMLQVRQVCPPKGGYAHGTVAHPLWALSLAAKLS